MSQQTQEWHQAHVGTMNSSIAAAANLHGMYTNSTTSSSSNSSGGGGVGHTTATTTMPMAPGFRGDAAISMDGGFDLEMNAHNMMGHSGGGGGNSLSNLGVSTPTFDGFFMQENGQQQQHHHQQHNQLQQQQHHHQHQQQLLQRQQLQIQQQQQQQSLYTAPTQTHMQNIKIEPMDIQQQQHHHMQQQQQHPQQQEHEIDHDMDILTPSIGIDELIIKTEPNTEDSYNKMHFSHNANFPFVRNFTAMHKGLSQPLQQQQQQQQQQHQAQSQMQQQQQQQQSANAMDAYQRKLPHIKEEPITDVNVQQKSLNFPRRKVQTERSDTLPICQRCKQVFLKKHSYVKHVAQSTCDIVEYDFKCSICPMSFMGNEELHAHELVHQGQKYFCHKYCGKYFDTIELCEVHEYMQHDYPTYVCNFCAATFSTREQLFTHMPQHKHQQRYDCPVCRVWFQNAHELHQHRVTAPYYCGKYYGTKERAMAAATQVRSSFNSAQFANVTSNAQNNYNMQDCHMGNIEAPHSSGNRHNASASFLHQSSAQTSSSCYQSASNNAGNSGGGNKSNCSNASMKAEIKIENDFYYTPEFARGNFNDFMHETFSGYNDNSDNNTAGIGNNPVNTNATTSNSSSRSSSRDYKDPTLNLNYASSVASSSSSSVPQQHPLPPHAQGQFQRLTRSTRAEDICCVPKCGVRKPTSPTLQFFPFPKDDKYLLQWLHNLKVPYNPHDTYSNCRICSLHFPKRCINRYSLCYWAVPTFNLGHDDVANLYQNRELTNTYTSGELARCSMPACQSQRGESNFKFYNFPNEPRALIKWCQNAHLPVYSREPRHFCSRHFEDRCFGKFRLKPWAVPTLHLGTPYGKVHDNPSVFFLEEKKCCLPHCRRARSSDFNLSLYRFPRDELLLQRWCYNLRLDASIYRGKNHKICSAHFVKEALGLRKLSPGAVPTLNLGHNDRVNIYENELLPAPPLPPPPLPVPQPPNSHIMHASSYVKTSKYASAVPYASASSRNVSQSYNSSSAGNSASSSSGMQFNYDQIDMCCVPRCGRNRHQHNVTLHTIPRRLEQLQKWAHNLKMDMEKLQHKAMRICSAHFEPYCIGGCMRPFAVPTLQLGHTDSNIHRNPDVIKKLNIRETCCVQSCKRNRDRDHANLHRFPSNTVLLQKWCENLCRPLPDGSKMFNDAICEVHFEARCLRNKRLEKWAIPTLLLGNTTLQHQLPSDQELLEFATKMNIPQLSSELQGECCVESCRRNTQVDDIKLYRSPDDVGVLAKWAHNLQLPNESLPTLRICNLHFEEQCCGKHRLKAWAIPTLNLGRAPDQLYKNPHVKPGPVAFDSLKWAPRCCLPHCRTTRLDGVQLFRFPQINRKTLAKWCHNLQVPLTGSVQRRICSLHFDPRVLTKRCPVPCAVPTVDLNTPPGYKLYQNAERIKLHKQRQDVCILPSCQQTRADGVQLFRFPNNKRLRRKWSHNTRQNGNEALRANLRICSHHFEPHSFGIKRLCPGSIPTLHLGHDDARIFPNEAQTYAEQKCVVADCGATKEQVRLFKFPCDDDDQLWKWCNNLKMNPIDCAGVRICSRHFEPECIGPKLLYKWAIPTLQLGHSDAEIELVPIPPPEERHAAEQIHRCVVRGCGKTRKYDDAQLYSFPKLLKLFRRWKHNLRMTQLKFSDREKYKICNVHFEAVCLGTKRLNYGAIPTLQLGHNQLIGLYKVNAAEIQRKQFGVVKNSKGDYDDDDDDDISDDEYEEEDYDAIDTQAAAQQSVAQRSVDNEFEQAETNRKKIKVNLKREPKHEFEAEAFQTDSDSDDAAYAGYDDEEDYADYSYADDGGVEEQHEVLSDDNEEQLGDCSGSCAFPNCTASRMLLRELYDLPQRAQLLQLWCDYMQMERSALPTTEAHLCGLHFMQVYQATLSAGNALISDDAVLELELQTLQAAYERCANSLLVCSAQCCVPGCAINQLGPHKLYALPHGQELASQWRYNIGLEVDKTEQEENEKDNVRMTSEEELKVESVQELKIQSVKELKQEENIEEELNTQDPLKDLPESKPTAGLIQKQNFHKVCALHFESHCFTDAQRLRPWAVPTLQLQHDTPAHIYRNPDLMELPLSALGPPTQKCSVPMCDVNNKRLYAFPTDETLRSKWLQNLKLTATLTPLYRVCAAHFETHCFQTKAQLRNWAIPTLQLGHTEESIARNTPAEIATAIDIFEVDATAEKKEIKEEEQEDVTALAQMAHAKLKTSLDSVKCIVANCRKSRLQHGVRLFPFPVGSAMLKKWCHNLQLPMSVLQQRPRICHLHFHKRCIEGKQLRQWAKPTKHLGHSGPIYDNPKNLPGIFLPICCLPHCRKRRTLDNDLRTFGFPKQPSLLRKWCDNLKLTPTASQARLCVEHFEQQVLGHRKLRAGAVPTRNLGHDEEPKYNNNAIIEQVETTQWYSTPEKVECQAYPYTLHDSTDDEHDFDEKPNYATRPRQNSFDLTAESDEDMLAVSKLEPEGDVDNNDNEMDMLPMAASAEQTTDLSSFVECVVEETPPAPPPPIKRERAVNNITPICCLKHCRKQKTPEQHLSTFGFPKDLNLLHKWADNLQLSPYDCIGRVCIEHFELRVVGNRRLKPGAVPTMNLGHNLPLLHNNVHICESGMNATTMSTTSRPTECSRYLTPLKQSSVFRLCCLKHCRRKKVRAPRRTYSFPTLASRLRQWCRRLRLSSTYCRYRRRLRVCEIHFERSSKLANGRLRIVALPTLQVTQPKWRASRKRLVKKAKKLKTELNPMICEQCDVPDCQTVGLWRLPLYALPTNADLRQRWCEYLKIPFAEEVKAEADKKMILNSQDEKANEEVDDAIINKDESSIDDRKIPATDDNDDVSMQENEKETPLLVDKKDSMQENMKEILMPVDNEVPIDKDASENANKETAVERQLKENEELTLETVELTNGKENISTDDIFSTNNKEEKSTSPEYTKAETSITQILAKEDLADVLQLPLKLPRICAMHFYQAYRNLMDRKDEKQPVSLQISTDEQSQKFSQDYAAVKRNARMRAHKCSILDCETYAFNRNVKLYTFPRNIELRAKWQHNSQVQLKEKWRSRGLYKLCERHFEPYCFGKKQRLRKWAIPTLHLPQNEAVLYTNPVEATQRHLCCIASCAQHRDLNAGIQLYRFPSSQTKLLMKWLHNTHLNAERAHDARICSLHFQRQSINARGRLHKRALPTLHLGHDATDIHKNRKNQRWQRARVQRCTLPHCGKNSRLHGVRLYVLPQSENMRQEWLKNLQVPVEVIASDASLRKCKICSSHFESRCFKDERLLPWALPTLELGHNNEVDENPMLINANGCAIANCTAWLHPQAATLFSYPKHNWLRLKWSKNTRVKLTETNALRLCAAHFEPEVLFSPHKLRPWVVPTLRLGHQEGNIYRNSDASMKMKRHLKPNLPAVTREACAYALCGEVGKTKRRFELPRQPKELRQTWLQLLNMEDEHPTDSALKLCPVHYRITYDELAERSELQAHLAPLQRTYQTVCDTSRVRRLSCAVPGCPSHILLGAAVRLYPLPCNQELAAKWRHNAQLNVDLNRASVFKVCERHFEQHCIAGSSSRRLKYWAIPTLELPTQRESNIVLYENPDVEAPMKWSSYKHKCCVRNCPQAIGGDFDDTVPLFSFPKDTGILHKWLYNTQVTRREAATARICALHFKANCISNGQLSMWALPTVRLGHTKKEIFQMPKEYSNDMDNNYDIRQMYQKQTYEVEMNGDYDDMADYPQTALANVPPLLQENYETEVNIKIEIDSEGEEQYEQTYDQPEYGLDYEDTTYASHHDTEYVPEEDDYRYDMNDDPDYAGVVSSESELQEPPQTSRHCQVLGCSGHADTPGLTLHKFPMAEQLFNKWKHNSQIPVLRPYRWKYRICSRHFEAHCFQGSTRRLQSGSLPTLHLGPRRPKRIYENEFGADTGEEEVSSESAIATAKPLADHRVTRMETRSRQELTVELELQHVAEFEELPYEKAPLRLNKKYVCSIVGCNSQAGHPRITLHKFPMPEEQFRKWLHNTQLMVDPACRWKYKICSKHFEKQCFRLGNRLQVGSMPTLLLGSDRPTDIYENEFEGSVANANKVDSPLPERAPSVTMKIIECVTPTAVIKQELCSDAESDDITRSSGYKEDTLKLQYMQEFDQNMAAASDDDYEPDLEPDMSVYEEASSERGQNNSHLNTRHCRIAGCSSHAGQPGVKMHKFPLPEEMFQKWLHNTQVPVDRTCRWKYKICSRHFEPGCLNGRRFLTGTMPTLNLGPNRPAKIYQNEHAPRDNDEYVDDDGLSDDVTHTDAADNDSNAYYASAADLDYEDSMPGLSHFMDPSGSSKRADRVDIMQQQNEHSQYDDSVSDLCQAELQVQLEVSHVESYEEQSLGGTFLSHNKKRLCGIVGCNVRANPAAGVTLHKFPSAPSYFKKWRHNTQLPVTMDSRWKFKLCNRHFERECFRGKRLQAGTMPTLNLGSNMPAYIYENEFIRSELKSAVPTTPVDEDDNSRYANAMIDEEYEDTYAPPMTTKSAAAAMKSVKIKQEPFDDFHENESLPPATNIKTEKHHDFVYNEIKSGYQKCSLIHCQKQMSKDNVKLHKFPKTSEQQEKWSHNLRIQYDAQRPWKYLICSDHFESQCVDEQLEREEGKIQLQPWAVPTLNLGNNVPTIRFTNENCSAPYQTRTQTTLIMKKELEEAAMALSKVEEDDLEEDLIPLAKRQRLNANAARPYWYPDNGENVTGPRLLVGVGRGRGRKKGQLPSYGFGPDVKGIKRCSLPHCLLLRGDGIKLFRFPTDMDTLRKWEHNLQLAFDERQRNVLRVCSSHFEPYLIGVKRLLKGAVPTRKLGHNVKNLYENEMKTSLGNSMSALNNSDDDEPNDDIDNEPRQSATPSPLPTSSTIAARNAIVVVCGVPQCENSSDVVNMFPLPNNMHLRDAWLKRLRIPDTCEAVQMDTLRVCAAHFKPSFLQGGKLNASAVPKMRIPQCVVASCGNKSGTAGINLYTEFPSDEGLFKIWCHNLQLTPNSYIPGQHFVCSLHFESYFLGKNPNQLRPWAIPTLLLGHNDVQWSLEPERESEPTITCCVPQCGRMPHKTRPNLQFLDFPTGKAFSVWCKLFQLDEDVCRDGTKKVCSAHFACTSFINGQLKPDAQPTLKLPPVMQQSQEPCNFTWPSIRPSWMDKCVVTSCRATQQLYKFPEKRNLFVKWCHNLKLDYESRSHKQAAQYHICPKHFDAQCLHQHKLHGESVPTLHLGHNDKNIFQNVASFVTQTQSGSKSRQPYDDESGDDDMILNMNDDDYVDFEQQQMLQHSTFIAAESGDAVFGLDESSQ